MSASRTQQSITNAKVSLFFLIATFLLNFFSRKLFLDGLGTEVMGMRTTIWTFLGMLSLSELGIGTAVSVSLYKPLAEKNYTAINEIISILGWLYTRVFVFISLGLIVLLVFIEELIGNTKIPTEYAYLTIGAFFIGTMLSYTVNYKSTVLSADQKHYKSHFIASSSAIIKGLIQIALIILIETPYLYWIIVDIIFSIASVYLIDRVTLKEYPWLKISKNKGREYLRKHPEILNYSKNILIHNIAIFIFANSSQALIPIIINVGAVTLYENYKNLILNIRGTIYSAFSNLYSGCASLISEGDRERSYTFFWEIISLLYLIGGIGAFGLFSFSSSFITLWLGKEYVLEGATLLTLTLTAYLDFTRGTVDAYIHGYKLFKDIWSSILLGIIIIVLSVLLGSYLDWGITGILLGNYIGLILIAKIWKPYYLFREGFHVSPLLYFRGTLKFPIMTAVCVVITKELISPLLPELSKSFFNFFIHATWITGLFSAVLFIAFYATSNGFRRMSVRLKMVIINKLPFIKLRP